MLLLIYKIIKQPYSNFFTLFFKFFLIFYLYIIQIAIIIHIKTNKKNFNWKDVLIVLWWKSIIHNNHHTNHQHKTDKSIIFSETLHLYFIALYLSIQNKIKLILFIIII